MKIKKCFFLVIIVIAAVTMAIMFSKNIVKELNKYEAQIENMKTPTLEENSIGCIEGKLLISDYKGEYDATITAYLSSDLTTVKEQIISDEDGNYIMYFAEAGEYTIVINKIGYLTYTCTELIVSAGEIVKLEDITLIPGDVNQNGEVEIMDLAEISDNFSDIKNDLNKKYDLNNDGIINSEDREMLKNNYATIETTQQAVYTTRLIADEPVARIGDVTYTTLTAAINAVPTTKVETTIVMLKSISGTAYSITTTKNVKLDLNGKKITHTGNTISNYGILTTVDNNRIKGGIYSTGTSSTRGISNSGTLIVNDIIVNSTGYYGIYSTGDVDINSGTIIGSLQAGIGVAGSKIVNIKGGIITGTTKYGVYAISGAPTINLGDLDKEVGGLPIVQGEISGVYIPNTTTTFNYNNGIIKGKTLSIDSKSTVVPRTNYEVYTVSEGEEQVSRLILNDTVAIIQDDSLRSFSTLNAAINYAKIGEQTKITMLKNTIEENIIPVQKDIQLELNGKTINSTGNTINVNGSLNVISSIDGGKIESSEGYAINNSGSVTIGIQKPTISNAPIGEPNVEEVQGTVNITTPQIKGVEAIHINEGANTYIYDGKFIGTTIEDVDLGDGVTYKNGAILGNVTDVQDTCELYGYIENEFLIKILRTAGPECEITSSVGTSTNLTTVTYNFKFDEPVTGFSTDDITISMGTKGEFSIINAQEYQLIVTNNEVGNQIVTVEQGMCQSMITGSNNKLATLTVNIDRTGPVITVGDYTTTVSCDVTIPIYINDPNFDTSSFTVSDIYIGWMETSNETLTLMAVSNGRYYYRFHCDTDQSDINSVNRNINMTIYQGNIKDKFGYTNAQFSASVEKSGNMYTP